jgi:hypothetical protein
MTAGLPPMSKGIRVQYVSTAVIFMARSRVLASRTSLTRLPSRRYRLNILDAIAEPDEFPEIEPDSILMENI